jgi:hypothetical protein
VKKVFVFVVLLVLPMFPPSTQAKEHRLTGDEAKILAAELLAIHTVCVMHPEIRTVLSFVDPD